MRRLSLLLVLLVASPALAAEEQTDANVAIGALRQQREACADNAVLAAVQAQAMIRKLQGELEALKAEKIKDAEKDKQ